MIVFTVWCIVNGVNDSSQTTDTVLFFQKCSAISELLPPMKTFCWATDFWNKNLLFERFQSGFMEHHRTKTLSAAISPTRSISAPVALCAAYDTFDHGILNFNQRMSLSLHWFSCIKLTYGLLVRTLIFHLHQVPGSYCAEISHLFQLQCHWCPVLPFT